MDIGTNQRTGDLIMRYGFDPNSRPKTARPLDEALSCVLCCRATAVTTEYQRDSSSKRPLSSVVLAARSPREATSQDHASQVEGAALALALTLC